MISTLKNRKTPIKNQSINRLKFQIHNQGSRRSHKKDGKISEKEADRRSDSPAERPPVLSKYGSQPFGELRAGTRSEERLSQ